jgi:hypothetical protein
VESPEESSILGILKEQRLLTELDDLLREATEGFRSVDADPTKPITFGFVATLAVADLVRIPLHRARRERTSAFQALDDPPLARATGKAASTAQSRYDARQNFAGAVWHGLASALRASLIQRELARSDREDSSSSVYAANVAGSIFKKIDSYIDLYTSADREVLREAGILNAAEMVDPDHKEGHGPLSEHRSKSRSGKFGFMTKGLRRAA